MNKKLVRSFILKYPLTREIFFILGKRKVNLKKIDKQIKKLDGFIPLKKIPAIVTLTSYGKRIEELKYTLYSLILQEYQPDKIIVNLAEKDKIYVNQSLLDFEKYGVVFNYGEDLRSFKKLLPTLENYPDKVLVTVDDDMYYDTSWLKELWITHKEFPKDIIAHNIYSVSFENGKLKRYDEWPHSIITDKASFENFFVGCGGVLYPPDSLFCDVNKKELYQRLTPIADDIWFYFMAYMKGTLIRQPKHPHIKFHYVNPYREYGIVEGKTLTQENVGNGKNDIQFKAVLDYYNISEEDFINKLASK